MDTFTCEIPADVFVRTGRSARRRPERLRVVVNAKNKDAAKTFVHKFLGESFDPGQGVMPQPIEILPDHSNYGVVCAENRSRIGDLLGSIELNALMEIYADDDLSSVYIEVEELDRRRVLALAATPRLANDEDAFPLIAGTNLRMHDGSYVNLIHQLF